MDLTVFSVAAPAPGETVLGQSFVKVPGGKGGNQAMSAALAGAETHLVSCVGTDAFAGEVTAGLSDRGVRIECITTVDGQTGIAHIRVDDSGQNSIVVIPHANSMLDTTHVDAAFAEITTPSVLLTQLEVPTDVAMYAMTKAKAAGMLVVLDPAPARELDPSIWSLIDIVTPNEGEALAITGVSVVDHESARRAGRWFVERGVAVAIITMAADGALIVSRAGHTHVPPLPVSAVDTTAAGDAFSGYLGAHLALGYSLEEAATYAVVAGALAVTRPGASSSLPAKDEVHKARERWMERRISGEA